MCCEQLQSVLTFTDPIKKKLFGWWNQEEWDGSEYGTYKGKEWCKGGLVGNMKERDHLEGLGVGGRILLKWIFKK
jgi:hypothetical protein